MIESLFAVDHVLVGAGGVTVWRAGRLRGKPRLLADVAMEGDDAGACLAEAFGQAGLTGRPVAYTVDDGFARHFMVTPPRNAASLADCRASAQLRLLQLHGENAETHAIAADWDAADAFLASALPHSLLATLADTAAARRCPVLSIAPYFVACWNRLRRSLDGDTWFAVASRGRLTLAAVAGGRLHAVRTLPFADGDGQASLAALVRREALRLMLETPRGVHVCGGLAIADGAADDLVIRRLGGSAAAPGSSGMIPAGALA